MEWIIDVHTHVGHRFEWTKKAQAAWMDTGPYVPRLFDKEERQIPESYGDAIKEEAWAGILIPEYSPGSAGLMPTRLLEYFPAMSRRPDKFLFGSDFPGVPGIRKNYDALARLLKDDEALHRIGFQNAYELFGFWKEGLFEVRDENEIFRVVNDAAERYKGVIPADRWRDPYMPVEEVRSEMKRMRFYGFRKEMELQGVMGKERVADTTLIRHAYVNTESQGKGIGSKLLAFVEKQVDTEWLLVGAWQAATWAAAFYRKHGYEPMPHKHELLRRYWDIPNRQRETSTVLGKRMHTL